MATKRKKAKEISELENENTFVEEKDDNLSSDTQQEVFPKIEDSNLQKESTPSNSELNQPSNDQRRKKLLGF